MHYNLFIIKKKKKIKCRYPTDIFRLKLQFRIAIIKWYKVVV